MRTSYSRRLGGGKVLAVADLVEWEGPDPGSAAPPGYVLTRINVPQDYRGLGVGSALLREVCREADLEHVPLWVEPQPYPDSPLQLEALVAFYRRHGFICRSTGLLLRLPARVVKNG